VTAALRGKGRQSPSPARTCRKQADGMNTPIQRRRRNKAAKCLGGIVRGTLQNGILQGDQPVSGIKKRQEGKGSAGNPNGRGGGLCFGGWVGGGGFGGFWGGLGSLLRKRVRLEACKTTRRGHSRGMVRTYGDFTKVTLPSVILDCGPWQGDTKPPEVIVSQGKKENTSTTQGLTWQGRRRCCGYG